MDTLIRMGAAFRREAGLGYGLALAAFALALALRLWLDRTLPPGFPYLTFFPAVILVTFLAGRGPGALCAVLCGLASWYWFIPPFNGFGLSGSTALALGFYAFIVSVDIALLHYMHVAAERMKAQQDVTAALYQQQRVMFQELQHRVANNLTLVSSLLSLQHRKVAADPGRADEAFREAQHRIEIMARVHRRLYDPASVDVPVEAYFREITADLLGARSSENVSCRIEVPPVSLDVGRLMPLTLLVTELVTNSLKHAFPEGAGGTITVAIDRTGPGELRLSVRDDGRGLPPDFELAHSRGLGTRIVAGLAAQLGGTLALDRPAGGGTAFSVSFPG